LEIENEDGHYQWTSIDSLCKFVLKTLDFFYQKLKYKWFFDLLNPLEVQFTVLVFCPITWLFYVGQIRIMDSGRLLTIS